MQRAGTALAALQPIDVTGVDQVRTVHAQEVRWQLGIQLIERGGVQDLAAVIQMQLDIVAGALDANDAIEPSENAEMSERRLRWDHM